jgi:hypothetical protein
MAFDGESTVGGRHVQQALQLLTERQGRKQETHPNDKLEAIGNQVVKSNDRACTQRSICYWGNNTSDNILGNLYMYLLRTAVDPIPSISTTELIHP